LLFRLSYESDLDMQAGIEPARDEVAAHRVPISPLHEFGARGETRTPIFTSVYGSPVRSRCRVRARIGSPSRNRTGAGRFRAGCSATELKGIEIGQGGWIRTNVLLLPRQAGTTGLPYTLMIGLPGRSRTCILRVRSTVLIRLSYGKRLEPRMGIDPISPD
jgi:hypothetical protein